MLQHHTNMRESLWFFFGRPKCRSHEISKKRDKSVSQVMGNKD